MNNRTQAILTTCEWLEQKSVSLDAETTGLNGTAEVCDLAVVAHDGKRIGHCNAG